MREGKKGWEKHGESIEPCCRVTMLRSRFFPTLLHSCPFLRKRNITSQRANVAIC